MPMPFRKQQRDYWCGPACAQMLLRKQNQATIARAMQTNKRIGTSRSSLVRYLQRQGAGTNVYARGSIRKLSQHVPAIVNYQEVEGEDHYAIVTHVTRVHVIMHDPWHGPNYVLRRNQFLRRWKNQRLRKKYTGWMVAVR